MCLASDQMQASCLYTGIVDLFTRWVVPSDLAAALWQVLGSSGSVVDMGTATDRLGRDGHAVGLLPDPEAANQLRVLIIDPSSGQLMAWEQISMPTPEFKSTGPFVSGFQAIDSSHWVTP